MDTITHGFAGALLGKGLFSTHKSETPEEFSPQARVAICAATLGSIFPDVDIFCDLFSHDDMAMLKYHRYVTHSIVMLPIWAALIAWLIRWAARRLKFEPPSFGWTWLATAVGIGSHILLDLATSFGTMVWSPISRARPAWDWIFIIDLAMSALLLVPQVASWVHRDPKRNVKRASRMWALFTVLALCAVWLAAAAGFPMTRWVVPVASAIFALVFFLPLRGNAGARIHRSAWARAGLILASGYLVLCVVAHQVALSHLKKFAAAQKIHAQELAAMPLAPSILHWEGLIRVADGVYRRNEEFFVGGPASYDFYPDSAPENIVQEAAPLPDTRTYLWFARFPVFRARRIGDEEILDIEDIQFMMPNSRQPRGFVYRGTFDASGNVIHEGMVRTRR
jgi:membrane-bound metal-dependent hydrolase YbcI (DUF457 family)